MNIGFSKPFVSEGMVTWYVRAGEVETSMTISLSKSNCALYVEVDSFFVDSFFLFVLVLVCALCFLVYVCGVV